MRIMIADDHGIVRQGLRGLLEKETDLEVVGEVSDGHAAVETAKRLHPDLIIMDITMPGLNGIDATRQILKDDPHTKVIVLSAHAEPQIVRDTLLAGALGYVLKTYLFEDLASAIRSAGEGRHYLSPRIAGVVVEDYLKGSMPEGSKRRAALTSREREIIQLISEEKSTKQIGQILHISPKTADSARRKIMDKVGISSVAGLTKYAIGENLTSADY